jgi:cytoskeletal protein CcmA (bactofilin family)
MFKKEEIDHVKDDVKTVIGPSVQVEGNFNAAGDVIVEGIVSGSMKTEKNLQVGTDAKIYANVSAGTAHVSGEIHGNLKVKNSLELTGTAKIYGDIKTKTLIIASGASFSGKCQAGEDKKKTEKLTTAKDVKKENEHKSEKSK